MTKFLAKEDPSDADLHCVPPKHKTTAYARFWSKVPVGKLDTCWEWSGALTGNGYPSLSVVGVNRRAHRIMFQLMFGTIAPGLYVLHGCDNRRCVNPLHLHLGTMADNNRECRERGRNNPVRGAQHPRNKITDEQAMMILSDPRGKWLLGKVYGVSPGTIGFIRKGATKKHVYAAWQKMKLAEERR